MAQLYAFRTKRTTNFFWRRWARIVTCFRVFPFLQCVPWFRNFGQETTEYTEDTEQRRNRDDADFTNRTKNVNST